MHTNNGDISDNQFQTYNTHVFIYSDQDMTGIKNWKEKMLSILEGIPAEADKIEPLVQFIVAAITPSKIYMMKHQELDTASHNRYIDLLIVIPSGNNKPFIELEPILNMFYLKDWKVSCSLHNEGNILEGLRNGHIFYSSQCIPENLIYDDKALAYPITPPEIIIETKKQAYLSFEQNYTRAVDFREAATSLHKIRPSRITVFLLHQAAELTFKGILQSLNGYDKKTHEIRQLRKYIRRCAPQLCDIFAEDSEEDMLLLDILDNAYSHARYVNDYQVSEEDLTVLFKKVTLLLETAEKVAHSILRS